MKKILRRVIFTLISLIGAIFILGLILAYLPVESKTHHVGVTPEQAAELRQKYTEPHHLITTTDVATLFLRQWNPDTIVPSKKDIAVLILHGITAYSGAYNMAGKPISAGGYTTFGLDYRGHGLSSGNRGDCPNKERWYADLAETVKYIKGLGYSKVVVLGHSLGVASAICTANAVPDEIAGLILLSGAYEGKKGLTKPPTFFEKARVFASSIFRPSHQAVGYYREGMTVTEDPLFNFKYTLRFLTMLDVKQLRLPKTMNIPVLVGVGDKDELFDVDKVKDFYDLIPGDKKEFLVMKNTTHAKIPLESWLQTVDWLNKVYVSPNPMQ